MVRVLGHEVMQESDQITPRNLFLSSLLTIGFAFLGGLIGASIGNVLFRYFLPAWNQVRIDSAGQAFNEIVLVDFLYPNNTDISQDNVILRATDGDYYSYYRNEWKPAESPAMDKSEFPYNYPPCDEWRFPPPVTYLRRVKDSAGMEYEHALAVSARCYVLLTDGTLHAWTRDYGVFEALPIVGTTLAIGVLSGGFLGFHFAKRRNSAHLG